ncbi:MAG: hypothetical protein IMF09_11340, partial [Proteobacteria bacterium]|nr:hypothetical protein [Pseudomonadota bacterium]
MSINSIKRMNHMVFFVAIFLFSVLPITALAQSATPTFSKAFAPATIGSGGTTLLTFTIGNSGTGDPVSGLAFTDPLPVGITIASPANA